MTSTAIKEQIEAIEKVTAELLKSKEAALKFLINAGIIKDKSSIKKATAPSGRKKN